MELRPLGHTGLSVSPIGLGLVKLGRATGLKHPGTFELPDDAAARALLDTAAELGINLLDTAPAYGTSEERLGELLAAGAGGGRDRFLISTKAGEEFDGRTSRFDFSPAAITTSVERSLRRLRTDRLDVVLLHLGPDDHRTLIEEQPLEALARLKQQGKIRAIGASTRTVDAAGEAMDRGSDVLMLTCNPRDCGDEPVIIEAGQRGVGVMIKKGLLSGHLGELATLAPAELAAAAGDPVEACLRYIFAPPPHARRDAIASVITGTISPGHLRHNVEAATRALARK